MGTSTDGILAYGYDLGGTESEWKFEAPWWTKGEWGWEGEAPWGSTDGDDEGDFSEWVEKTLRVRVGEFAETDRRADGFFKREADADARVGVKLETYCSGEYPLYLLGVKIYVVSRGDAEAVDFTVGPSWDTKLRIACEALEIKPLQDQPKWLLASYWG